MKSMLGTIVFVIVAIVFISGLQKINHQNIENGKNDVVEWVSPDGVHYWVYSGGYQYGIAPRFDNNGNLVIDNR